MDGRICVRISGLRAQRSAWREFSYPLAQVSSSKSPARLSDGAPATQARQEGNSFFIQVTCTGEGGGGRGRDRGVAESNGKMQIFIYY